MSRTIRRVKQWETSLEMDRLRAPPWMYIEIGTAEQLELYSKASINSFISFMKRSWQNELFTQVLRVWVASWIAWRGSETSQCTLHDRAHIILKPSTAITSSAAFFIILFREMHSSWIFYSSSQFFNRFFIYFGFAVAPTGTEMSEIHIK